MIPLLKPFMPELPELNKILYSGSLASGEYTRQFEDSIREYLGTPYILVTNTFNLAVFVVVSTLGLNHGDEVIASPMGCLASTQPYLAAGMKVKWCDIDPKRGTLSPDALRKVISSKTKAIVHNHFCGYPGYVNEINDIGKEFGIPVIDDGIECFGSEYKGNKMGCCGTDVSIFSLGAVRLPNTIDGGIIVFKNEKVYKKALRIRDCGIDRDTFRDELGEIDSKCDITEIGYSATMSNVNAYIGLQQMKKLDELFSVQRKNAQHWDAKFNNHKNLSPIQVGNTRPNYWVYGLRVKEKCDAIRHFREEGWYASGVHINNNIYSIFDDKSELPGVDDFYAHFVAVPCGWWIGDNK